MSKFSMKLKVQGFELEVSGTREDAEKMTQAIKEQMAGLLPPVSTILDGATDANNDDLPLFNVTPRTEPAVKKARRKRGPVAAAAGGSGDKSNVGVTFAHDPERFGTPSQDWKTAEKAVWFLYAHKESGNSGQLTAKEIADTFNLHFKESGVIATGNVKRDLGALKAKEKPAPVGNDAVQGTWYLTEEGRRRAQTLVIQALGKSE